jgi:hypothetical protein
MWLATFLQFLGIILFQARAGALGRARPRGRCKTLRPTPLAAALFWSSLVAVWTPWTPWARSTAPTDAILTAPAATTYPQTLNAFLNWGAAIAALMLDAYTSLSWAATTALYMGMAFAVVPLTLLLVVALKWLLLGRLRPGTYPLWGWTYVRWWTVTGLVEQVRGAGPGRHGQRWASRGLRLI